ncbi:unnamed protein product, partial [Polarella glacialis]
AALLQRSVTLNGLDGIVEVFNVAAGGGAASSSGGGKNVVRLKAKPRSSNSFTPAAAAGAAKEQEATAEISEDDSQIVEVPIAALDDVVRFSSLELLISHTNGQELAVLRGARRLLARSRDAVVILQLYGPESGVIRDPGFDPTRAVRWLAEKGFDVSLARRPGLRFRAPGVLRSYFKMPHAEQVVNVVGVPLRRKFLWGPASAVAPSPPKFSLERRCMDLAAGERPNTWAEVDGRVLRENLHIVRMHLGRSMGGNGGSEDAPPIGVVLKANAYGHGAVLAGRVLASAKVDALFISEVETGLQLRALPEVPPSMPMILLYRSADSRDVACLLAAANITASVLSLAWVQQALRWHPCAAPLRLHLMVDSGLGREGLAPEEVASATEAVLRHWPHWSLEGLYTHWCCPYDKQEMAKSSGVFAEALARVHDLRATAGDAGGAPFMVHTSSSSTAFYGLHYDMLRIGGLLFGDPVLMADPEGDNFKLPGPHRTLLWKSRISALRWSRPGERYARCGEAEKCATSPLFKHRLLLATIPVGGSEFSDTLVLS